MDRKAQERRRFFRTDVDLAATLYLQASDDMRRSCRIFNLSGSGCAVRIASLEPIGQEATHQLRFELPNRSEALFFDCELVRADELDDETGQDLRFRFLDPRPGFQDAVISYIQNRKRFERTAFRVAIPVSMEAQTGIRQFIPYKGNTMEVGRDYALCDLPRFGLAVSSEVVATFLGPKFRDEIFFQATVTKVERNMYGGYKVRILFDSPGDQMLDFIRRHYAAKAKPITTGN